ncbi:MAG TPA: acyltransferase [Luteibacter sp.]|jgi:peptidoglycan/LPS O-acetylase OafA/YrhL|nr:acyltransferase [Luteibacter sp.]
MRSQNVGYMPALDHLRFFAALLIVVFHLVREPVVKALHLDIGVPLFFALSGFLFFIIATEKTGSDLNYWKFIKNRFLRIYPLVIVLFFLTIVVMDDFTAIDYFHLFGLNLPGTGEVSWHAGDWGYRQLSFNWWTVGVEFVFYLLFPFLYRFYRKEGAGFLWRATILIALFRLGLYYAFLESLGWKTLAIKLNYAVLGNFDIFLIGMLAAHYMYRIKDGSMLETLVHSKLVFLAYTAGMGVFLYCLADILDATTYPIVAGALCSMLVLLYSRAFMRYAQAPWSRALSFGGTLSFSIYLLHAFVRDALAGMGATDAFKAIASVGVGETIAGNAFFLCFALYIPCILAVSYLTWRTIEKPFLELRTAY